MFGKTGFKGAGQCFPEFCASTKLSLIPLIKKNKIGFYMVIPYLRILSWVAWAAVKESKD